MILSFAPSRCRKRRGLARRHKGVTLIELLAVLAILGVMAAIAVPVSEMALQRNKERQLREALREIRGALDRYREAVDQGRIARGADESGYPPSLEILVEGVVDQRSPTRSRLYFLRRIPTDPMTVHSAHRGRWLLRSFQSSADDPKAGADVFDVLSRSSRIGLNGVPYKQW